MAKLSKKDKEIIALGLQIEQLRTMLETERIKDATYRNHTTRSKEIQDKIDWDDAIMRNSLFNAGMNWGKSYLSSLEMPLSERDIEKPVWIINTHSKRISGSALYLLGTNDGIIEHTSNPLEAKRFEDKQDAIMYLVHIYKSALQPLQPMFQICQLNPDGTVD